ncbi:hypothetical protein [Methylobacterium planeticum]|uniref:Uncharacterized protein n=1 Tax=Methylobacterium planeticum TaxID=2615211 RepID=A0A6N6MLN7_9HYPH|nr:hypothetical protein [Methylobacterium planeticum]KAB1071217.1 hypothetical protein F6X51_20225 [Methylobacterium planeticum]
MAKFQLYIPNTSFNFPITELEQTFGKAESAPELDYCSLNHPDYRITYATDHVDNVLAVLDIDTQWQIPAPVQHYVRGE